VWDDPIEQAVNHLIDNDVPVEEGPIERHGARGRGRSVYFRDPDGTLLEFSSYQ
jgi:catechol 2,3-dioxygenase-like lactoylglutathione lyase family enzyme